ncbi:hypothetical protein [Streptomyces purpurascens]
MADWRGDRAAWPGLLAGVLTNPQAMIATLLSASSRSCQFAGEVPGLRGRSRPRCPSAYRFAALPGVDVKTLQVGNLLASVSLPGADNSARSPMVALRPITAVGASSASVQAGAKTRSSCTPHWPVAARLRAAAAAGCSR